MKRAAVKFVKNDGSFMRGRLHHLLFLKFFLFFMVCSLAMALNYIVSSSRRSGMLQSSA